MLFKISKETLTLVADALEMLKAAGDLGRFYEQTRGRLEEVGRHPVETGMWGWDVPPYTTETSGFTVTTEGGTADV